MSIEEVAALGASGDIDQLIGGLILIAVSFVFWTTLHLVRSAQKEQQLRGAIRRELALRYNLRHLN
jgi:hypothetical protein